MCKKPFVSIIHKRKTYKVYIADVLRAHSVTIKKLPSLPAYMEMECEKNSDK